MCPTTGSALYYWLFRDNELFREQLNEVSQATGDSCVLARRISIPTPPRVAVHNEEVPEAGKITSFVHAGDAGTLAGSLRPTAMAIYARGMVSLTDLENREWPIGGGKAT